MSSFDWDWFVWHDVVILWTVSSIGRKNELLAICAYY